MNLSAGKQALIWGTVALVFVLVLWGLGDVLMPFLLGMGIAYLLDPVADRLERSGLSRVWAVTLITLVVIFALMAALVLLIPLLVRQGTQLIQTAPAMIDRLQDVARTRFPAALPEGGVIDSTVDQIGATLGGSLGGIMGTVLGSLGGVVSFFMVIVIAPVIAFYMLLDWDRMIRRIDLLLPRPHADALRGIFGQIDDSISGFVRGQAVVILILGTFYSLGLALVGLPFGIVIGVSAASLSFIPYVGTLVGGTLSIGVALFTFWGEWAPVLAVIAIFVVGQVAEGNYLQPKIVGGQVGLHPVWLMLALGVFGSLFGFAGLLIAVPLGAALGVLVRFLIDRYKVSALYTGREPPPRIATPTLIELVPPGTVAQRVAQQARTHEDAVRDARVETARSEARIAAEEAAGSDRASVAVAEVQIRHPDAPASEGTGEMTPRVKTWGGRSPDGDEPRGNDAAGAPRTAAEMRQRGERAGQAAPPSGNTGDDPDGQGRG